jgi:3-oxoacyl-[acyl-carrier-protein] synthase-1
MRLRLQRAALMAMCSKDRRYLVSVLVEVVATGARTSVGLTCESCAAAVRAGVTNHNEYPFITPSGEPVIVAADSQLQPSIEGRDRIVALVMSVIDEALQNLTQSVGFRGQYRLLLALPEERPGFSEDDAKWVTDVISYEIQARGLTAQVDIGGRGHAGSIQAIEQVVEECSQREDILFLVVGADSYHHVHTFLWLEDNLQFAQRNIRSGFVPGEGAGCLVLASSRLRSTLNLPLLAIIVGIGTALETILRDSETGSFGIGMTAAVRKAAKELQLPCDSVGTVYSDINGERYRSEEWGFVAMRTPMLWKSLDYEAPSNCWGDVGAAFGTLAGMLVVQSFARRYAQDPRAMVMAGSESGLRGAMLLQDPRIQ